MGKAMFSLCVALVLLIPAAAHADSYTLSTSISTSGTFSCDQYQTCISGPGGSSLTIPGAAGSATITFTGVTHTLEATNSLTTTELGLFEVTATDGYTFPVNLANPELPIFRFNLLASNPVNPLFSTQLMWFFGPGGGATLSQFGPWDLSVPLDSYDGPYTGINFFVNRPMLAINSSTSLTAEVGLVPEPSTMLLIGTGLAGAAWRRRRKVVSTT